MCIFLNLQLPFFLKFNAHLKKIPGFVLVFFLVIGNQLTTERVVTQGAHFYKYLVITFWKCVLTKAISSVVATEGKVIVLWINAGEKK